MPTKQKSLTRSALLSGYRSKSRYSLGIHQMLYSFQCHQLTALMDVAYVGLIQQKPVILHRRNMTVGIGCGCKEMQIQRRQQLTGIVAE